MNDPLAYIPSFKAKKEVDELLASMMQVGLSSSVSIKLEHVRELMMLCWDRGYSARQEELN